MNTKTMIIIGSVAAAGVVLFGLRKKINAMLSSQQTVLTQSNANATALAKAGAASNMPFGNLQRMCQPAGRMPFYGMGDTPAVPMQAAVATTQTVATLVNTSVTTLAGIAGLALTAMTLMEKKKSLKS